jgi:hypothetical protein
MGHTGSDVYKMRVGTTNGSGVLTAGFSWDGTLLNIIGSVTATAGSIGGFIIGADHVRDTANTFGLASTVTGGDDVRFWAGNTFANRAIAPFRVTEAGVVNAASGVIRFDPQGLSVVSTTNNTFVKFLQGAVVAGEIWSDSNHNFTIKSFAPSTGATEVRLMAIDQSFNTCNFSVVKASGTSAYASLFSGSSTLAGLIIGNVDAATTPTAMLDVRGNAIFAAGSNRVIVQVNSAGVLSPLNLYNSDTGAAAGAGMLFGAGASPTAGFIGGAGSQRIDASSNSRTAFRVLSNGSLTGLDTTATFYLEGSSSGAFIVANARVGIGGAPGTGTALDIQSTTGFVRLPRMTTTQRDAITPADGDHFYNTTLGTAQYRKAGAWVSY